MTPHAYWYVDNNSHVTREELRNAAEMFENRIYPKVTDVFGREWIPGIDNDDRITILNTNLSGFAGYFSAADEYPKMIHPGSNEREMIYMNTGAFRVGSREYLSVLAHELQHAVHWNGDNTEETWVNEGLSEVASFISGFIKTPGPAPQS